jgi:microcystin-dependent protein
VADIIVVLVDAQACSEAWSRIIKNKQLQVISIGYGKCLNSWYGLPMRWQEPDRRVAATGLALSAHQIAGAAPQLHLDLGGRARSPPSHSHTFNCATDRGNSTSSSNSYLGTGTAGPPNQAVHAFPYSTSTANAQMNPFALSPSGGNQPHNNMMPFLGLTFIIALQGIFPARS